jgi:hypothetical protein
MAEGSDKSGGLSPGTIVLFILAFFGIGAPLMLSSKPAPSTSLPSAKGTEVSGEEISAADLLEDFFDADPEQFVDRDQPWQQDDPIYPETAGAWSRDDPRRNDRISFLIATLPNPENPSLRYEFDRYMDSIQRALSHEYYLLDKISLTTKSESTARANITPAERLRRPGVLLFRRRDSQNSDHPARESLVVVFVVGETPTNGVDEAALRSALDQIAWLRGWTHASGRPAPPHLTELTHEDPNRIANRITIIGPSYSGSATSIQQVLRSWLYFGGLQQPTPPISISLLSGSATAIRVWPSELGDFRSTERPEYETFWKVKHFFSKGLRAPRIAILADDTSYGNSISKSAHIKSAHIDPVGVTVLPYPAHISNVRTAFENEQIQEANPGATPMGFAHRDLSIRDEDPGQDSYSIPEFSRASAADDEVVLANLLSTIHREKFHYVGIVATNIQDAIFLIREIRDNCPDTTPFLESSDLLYLHSKFNRDLVGTLIFSTYPLFASNQLWTWPSNSDDSRRIQFPSGESEGVYNAALAAVDDANLMVEYTQPFSSGSQAPPLWVSVVGNDALWPIATFLSPPGSHVLKRPPPHVAANVACFRLPRYFGLSLYPHQLNIAFALVLLLCTVPHLYLVRRDQGTCVKASWLDRFLARTTPPLPVWLARLIEEPATVNRTNRRLSFLSLILVLLSFYIVASAVWLLPLRAMSLWSAASAQSENFWLLIWNVGPTLIAGALIFQSLARLTRSMVTEAKEAHEKKWLTATFTLLFSNSSWTASLRFIASIIGVVVTLIFTVSIWWQEPIRALLYFVRAANLWNGVSPLLPLLYIGVAALWLSISELWRVNASAEYVLTRNFLGFGDDGSFTGIGAHKRATIHLLKCTTDDIPFWLLWLTLPLVFYVLADMPGIQLIALDGRVFTCFFITIAIFVYTSFLLLFGRFIAVWIELRSLLHRLAMHPTRRAYEELRTGSVAPSMAARQHIPLVAPPESVIAVEFCLERAREMLRLVEPLNDRKNAPALTFPDGTIAKRVSNARVALSDLMALVQLLLALLLRAEADGGRQGAIRWRIWLQIAMSDLSRQITAIFEPRWRLDREVRLTANSSKDQSDLDESLLKNGELFVATRVVDFLHQVFPQLMNLVVFTSVGLLALMLAVSSYPFPQRDTVAWLSWIILLTVIGVFVVVFVQINRDRVVSMLSGTTPGQLNWNSGFVWQLVVFGLLPILTLLGAQFPHALQGVFSSFGGLASNAH